MSERRCQTKPGLSAVQLEGAGDVALAWDLPGADVEVQIDDGPPLPVADVGEHVAFDGHVFTVTELDGRRIAKVRFTPKPPEEPAAGEPAPPEAASGPRSGQPVGG